MISLVLKQLFVLVLGRFFQYTLSIFRVINHCLISFTCLWIIENHFDTESEETSSLSWIMLDFVTLEVCNFTFLVSELHI